MLDSFSTTIEQDQQILGKLFHGSSQRLCVSELHFELKLIPTNVPDSDVHISKTREIAVKYVNNLFVMLLVIFFSTLGLHQVMKYLAFQYQLVKFTFPYSMHRYRLHRKMLLQKIIDSLDIYQDRILFQQNFQQNLELMSVCVSVALESLDIGGFRMVVATSFIEDFVGLPSLYFQESGLTLTLEDPHKQNKKQIHEIVVILEGKIVESFSSTL